MPGPETDRLGAAARDASLHLTIGVFERDGGTLYCCAPFFGPNGALLGEHRKTLPAAAEHPARTAGASCPRLTIASRTTRTSPG